MEKELRSFGQNIFLSHVNSTLDKVRREEIMTFKDLQFIINRAAALTFAKKKLLFVFAVLALCGMLIVFFRGLASTASPWMLQSFTFLPIFLCSGILLASGIILIRIYHNEIKQKTVSYREVLTQSWEVVIGASYFAIPMILGYLLLWMLLGIFMLFGNIPLFGDFFKVVLAFAPFLINLCTIILCLLTFAVLFYVSPVVALKGLNRNLVAQITVRKFQEDPFSNLLLAFIALLPILCSLGILILAAAMTGNVFQASGGHLFAVIQWFFIMIPFTALLAPAVTFFFNFAAEAHVHMQRRLQARS